MVHLGNSRKFWMKHSKANALKCFVYLKGQDLKILFRRLFFPVSWSGVSPWFTARCLTLSNACERSLRISSTCTIPTDKRIKPGTTADEACSCSDNCWWVVDAGCIINVFESPTFARWLTSLRLLMNRSAASVPPLIWNDSTPPKPT